MRISSPGRIGARQRERQRGHVLPDGDLLVPLRPEEIRHRAPGLEHSLIELRRRREIAVRVHIPVAVTIDNCVDDGLRHLRTTRAIQEGHRMTAECPP
jgi:hypothetical protein